MNLNHTILFVLFSAIVGGCLFADEPQTERLFPRPLRPDTDQSASIGNRLRVFSERLENQQREQAELFRQREKRESEQFAELFDRLDKIQRVEPSGEIQGWLDRFRKDRDDEDERQRRQIDDLESSVDGFVERWTPGLNLLDRLSKFGWNLLWVFALYVLGTVIVLEVSKALILWSIKWIRDVVGAVLGVGK